MSTQVAAARDLVSLLRQERTLLDSARALHLPALGSTTATLIRDANVLLDELRGRADPQVLAVLPNDIAALPAAPPAGVVRAPITSRTDQTVTPATGVTGPSASSQGMGSKGLVSAGTSPVSTPAPLPGTLPGPPASNLPIGPTAPSTPSAPPTPSAQAPTHPPIPEPPLPLPSVLDHVSHALTDGLTAGPAGH